MPQLNVVSASKFNISIDGQSVATFSELSGINSEVEPAEYMYCDKGGKFFHTKQFGKVKPPTITLKRGMDDDHKLWAWHQAAVQGLPSARTTCQLQMYLADGKTVVQTYTLENAWITKLEVNGVGAGKSDVITMTVTLTCDEIIGDGA